jgi:hypothetical protein
MQLLALETGGTLHHHLPLDLPGARPHQLSDPAARHALVVEERGAATFRAARVEVTPVRCGAIGAHASRPAARLAAVSSRHTLHEPDRRASSHARAHRPSGSSIT